MWGETDRDMGQTKTWERQTKAWKACHCQYVCPGQTRAWGEHATVICLSWTDEHGGEYVTVTVSVLDRQGHVREHFTVRQTKAWGEHGTVNVSVQDRQRHGESMPLSMCLSWTDKGMGRACHCQCVCPGQTKAWGEHATVNVSVQDRQAWGEHVTVNVSAQDRHGHDEEHATVNVSLQDRQGHGGEHGTT
ncbi:hypothetical protein EDC04DRAFT_2604204 [Pisolithus marmoratus]|nr:hypothetical protein EDC04DRAFT_2604204 [Pisolithus marmoratus]